MCDIFAVIYSGAADSWHLSRSEVKVIDRSLLENKRSITHTVAATKSSPSTTKISERKLVSIGVNVTELDDDFFVTFTKLFRRS